MGLVRVYPRIGRAGYAIFVSACSNGRRHTESYKGTLVVARRQDHLYDKIVMSHPVKDVALFFLSMSQPDEGDVMTNLKVQKLCYYAQGFALVLLGQPLFNEKIEKWEHGPVVPDLYREYKSLGSHPIPPPTGFDAQTVFTQDEYDLLVEVWNTYGQFSAWKLRNMTHSEPPWKNATKEGVISHEALRKYFQTQVGNG